MTDLDLGVVLDFCWVDGYFMTTDGESLIVTELTDPMAVNPLKYGIEAINHPMNYTNDQLQDMINRQIGLSVLNAIGVIFSMSFVPASFVLFLVEERSSKAKHLQFVSGVKPATFWIASYTWDMVRFKITLK